MNRYIADSFCVECGIEIELVGAPQSSKLGEEYEAGPTRFLEAEGIVTLRFENRVFDHPRRADNLR